MGAVNGDHIKAWDDANEYHYLLESRSFTGLPEVSNEYSGIMMRGVLKIQPKSEQTLLGKLSKLEVASILAELPSGWDSEISHDLQVWQPLLLPESPSPLS